MQKKHLVFLGAFLVIVLAAGLALHLKNKADSAIPAPQEIFGQGTTVASTTPNYTIEPESAANLHNIAPNLDRATVYGESVPEAARAIYDVKIKSIIKLLKADSMRADDWFSLGVMYHSAGDYEGARIVWEFLLQVIPAPEIAVVYDNLGKLYKFNLKDFPKSERYFKQSISAAPSSMNPYIELFELYAYLYKTDTSAGVDILAEAAKKFPTATDPYTLLGSYYREKGEYAKARDAYTEALNRARDAGNVELIALIGNDLAGLPQQ